jgi:alkyldihydroxyacetonephosphate synthase
VPHFIPFVANMLGVTMEQFNAPQGGDALKPAFALTEPMGGSAKDALVKQFGAKKLEFGQDERLVRSRGGYYAYEIPTNTRLVDAIFFPETVEDVETVVQLAREHKLNLIPRGGGTNVSNMLEVPHKEKDPRQVLSVDMTRMTNLIGIDAVNQTAEIQAGATGREVEEQLNARGYTMGHEPDSYEFSTMGGWVSTAASGMKRTRYGNIEDIIINVKMVTSSGRHEKLIPVARYAHGSDIQNMIVGSEGNFGVITSVVVKVHQLPERQDFDSVRLSAAERASQHREH